MNRLLRLMAALAGALLVPLLLTGGVAIAQHDAAPERPELAYLKQVNAWHPPSDPQLLFLLMAQYAAASTPS